jgi:sodium-dependent dicarboxylate transporter 2/3/5
MLATGFITLWISNTAAAVMMVPIAMAVLHKFEEQRGRRDPLLCRFGLALMLGIGYAASIGGIGTKIGTGTNLVFVKHAAGILPRDIDFLTWLKLGLPLVLLVLPLVWLYLVRVAAPLPATEFPGGRQAIDEARASLKTINRGEKVALTAFLLAAFLWIFRRDIELDVFTIPGWWDLVPFGWPDILGRPLVNLPVPWPALLKDVGDAVVAITIGAALLVIPVQRRPLRFALGLRQAGGISWGLLTLLGGGFAMAYGIQQSGLSQSIAGVLGGMGKLDAFAAILAVCFISVTLTEVASNTATASILLPLLASSASSFGLHPIPLMLAATLSASFGFMLPAGTPPNAVVFSSGYITVPQMARSGLIVDLVGAFLIAVFCHFVTPIVLGLP